MDIFTAALWAILPTLVVLGLFLFVMRAVLRLDRKERNVYAQIEAEERAKRGLPPVGEEAPKAS